MIFINNIVPAESGSAVLMTQKGEKRKMTPVFLQDVLPRLVKKLNDANDYDDDVDDHKKSIVRVKNTIGQ